MGVLVEDYHTDELVVFDTDIERGCGGLTRACTVRYKPSVVCDVFGW